MPYVMVPVPEEHVEDVMQFVLRAVARASIELWDGDSVAAMWAEIDEETRSLLAFVARAAAEGRELEVLEAARQIQMTPREVTGILNELNVLTRDSNRPTLVVARNVPERQPNGRTREKRVLGMDAEVADLVRDAERKELSDARSALPGETD
jgi:hypothetical protein